MERGTVEVRSGGASSTHERVVVCAGRGTAALARGVGLSLPMRLGAHVRGTFEVRGDPPPRLVCLRDSSGQFGEVGAYAAPGPGNRRYAVGLGQSVDVREDGSLVDPGALASLAERASAYVARALPGLDPEPVELRHCWVTELPWSSEGVAVWEWEGILFVAGQASCGRRPSWAGAAARRAARPKPTADIAQQAHQHRRPVVERVEGPDGRVALELGEPPLVDRADGG